MKRLSRDIRVSAILKGILFLPFSLLFFTQVTAQSQECFLIMVGPEASATGQVLLAHNNDLTGTEASMLVRVPAGDTMNIFPGAAPGYGPSYSMLILQTNKGFAEGDAVAVNEHGVAVAGGLSLKADRSRRAEEADPLVKGGLGGGIRYFALQHARTARECVRIIGECYDRYGIGYPSGVGIADAQEMWYLESGGGHAWAAMRIPAGAFFVAANSYNLSRVDLSDTARYLCSQRLRQLAASEGYDRQGLFPFARFFGGGHARRYGDNRYNTLRLWRAALLLGSMHPATPGDTLPGHLHLPEHKITLQECFDVLRDHYQGTPYDLFSPANRSHPPRAIADRRCVHTDVITLTPGLPASYGAVLWTGLSTPLTAVYIPVFFGVDAIPRGYERAPDHYDALSAFWVFKKLTDLSWEHYPSLMKQWQAQRKEFERKELSLMPTLTRQAAIIARNDPQELEKYLGRQTQQFAREALRMATEQIHDLETSPKRAAAH